jgi:hypothetical protein
MHEIERQLKFVYLAPTLAVKITSTCFRIMDYPVIEFRAVYRPPKANTIAACSFQQSATLSFYALSCSPLINLSGHSLRSRDGFSELDSRSALAKEPAEMTNRN